MSEELNLKFVGLREARKIPEGSVVLIRHQRCKDMYELDQWFRPDHLRAVAGAGRRFAVIRLGPGQ